MQVDYQIKNMPRPTICQLSKRLKNLIDWQQFALNLPGIKWSDVKTIQQEVRDNIAGQKNKLFDKWLQVCPEASWEHVVEALNEAEQYTLAAEIERNHCSVLCYPTSRSLDLVPLEEQEVDEIQVGEEVVAKLEELHDWFVDLRQGTKTEINSAVQNGSLTIEDLVDHVEEQRAYPVQFESVATTHQFFQAIKPHYTFLDFHLIVSLAILLSGHIAARAKKYKEGTENFMKETRIKHLHKQLEKYFPNFQSDGKVRVSINLRNAWGKHKMWLVKQLVLQLFGLEPHDQCHWFRVMPGSLLIVFLVAKHLRKHVIEKSTSKMQFMRLMGIFELKIGDRYFLKSDEAKRFFFEFSLIEATFNRDIEAVQFLVQNLQIDVNFQPQGMCLDHPDFHQQHKNRLDICRDEFEHVVKYIYSLLKHILNDQKGTIQTLLDAIETKLHVVLSAESIKTADDFFQAIIPHCSFLNRHLLVSLEPVLSNTFITSLVSQEANVESLKKGFQVKYLLFLPYDLHVFQPDVSINVTIKLEDVWLFATMWRVEMLVQTIFSLKHPDEFQWFRVIPGSVNVVFLVARHKAMRLIVNGVKKRQFARRVGVVTLQVGNVVYTCVREGSISYSVKEAIEQANLSHDSESADFLQSFEHDKEYAWKPDENKNYCIFTDPNLTPLMIACCNNDLCIVKLLLDNKADPNAQNKRKYTSFDVCEWKL